MLNPWRLRLLSQLDSLGTVRAVAQAAHLSASSVSQQLAVLEAETRTQLLERTGRRVRLTPAGLMLARRARGILDQMDSVEAELRSLGEEPAGSVRLGAFQSAIHSLCVPAVTRLARTHPHLDVELIELEPHESMPALRVGDADIIITTTDFVEHPLGSDVDIVPLATDPIVLVLPPERAARGPADLAAYADEPWAFDMPKSYMANLATRLCRESGFEPRVVCRFSNYLMTLQHVEAGLSIALLPGLAVDPRYRVATRELAHPVTRTITAVIRRGAPPRAAVHLVLEELRRIRELPIDPRLSTIGVQGPSLYNHVGTKDEIIDAVVDSVLGEVDTSMFGELSADNPDWRSALRRWAHSYRSAVAAHPNIVPALASGPGLRPNALRMADAVFGGLVAANWPRREATTVGTLMRYFLTGSSLGSFVAGFPADAEVYAEEYPHLNEAHLLAERQQRIDQDAFEVGLESLLDGLEGRYRLLPRTR